ncbi:MAG: hypothetical protein R2865_14120 [Deinococcales bacterium]
MGAIFGWSVILSGSTSPSHQAEEFASLQSLDRYLFQEPNSLEDLGFVSTFRDVTERESLREKLKDSQDRDKLTKLINQEGFKKILRQSLATLHRQGSALRLSLLRLIALRISTAAMAILLVMSCFGCSAKDFKRA